MFYLISIIVYYLDQLDCGITALGCCNTPTCQKLGNTKVFLVLFSLTGIFQGAAQSFFRVTARQAAVEHDYNPALVGMLFDTFVRDNNSLMATLLF